MTFLAKFGFIGLAVVAWLILGWVSFLRSLCSFNHPRAKTLALIASAGLAIPSALLTTPLEDKGFTLGLILFLALVLSTHRPASIRQPRS